MDRLAIVIAPFPPLGLFCGTDCDRDKRRVNDGRSFGGISMPHLLYLAQRIPYPPTKGDKVRAFHLLQHLASTYQVHLGCLADEPADLVHVPVLASLCADVHVAPLDRRRAKIKCLSGLVTGEPLSVTYYRDRGLEAWVRGVIAERQPEAIVVSSSNMAPYVLRRRGAERVRLVDLVDLDSEKWRAYAETGSPWMRAVHAREHRLIARLEARIARECDWCTFVSEPEASLFARVTPEHRAKIRAISNGVDHAYFDPARPYPPPFATDRPNFVFTGTMDYPPNADAVRWFAHDIFPAVQQAAPSAQFHIVGANPTREVEQLSALPGVFVTGRVPDVRPYLAHATAAAAPMRIARGIQNKVLEAMAMARPVVVTSGALEGIAATPGEHVLLADTPPDFAAACLGADPAVGEAARRLIVREYDWAGRLREFDALLASQAEPALT